MKITPKQYAELLYEATRHVEKSALTKAVRSFVELLVRNRALAMLPRIERLYQDVYNAQEGIIDVEITSTREVPKRVLTEIGKQIGKEVEVKVGENPKVLGGARIRVGDWMVDDTLKSRLTNLKCKLMSYGG